MSRQKIIYPILLAQLLFSFFIKLGKCQEPGFRWDSYSEKNGLCNRDIWGLAFDEKGFLWIGTRNGLSRFDGNNFKNFFSDGTINSISDNTIFNLDTNEMH